jgi:TRAP-type C4-dicarboxylate transport system permease small subunit
MTRDAAFAADSLPGRAVTWLARAGAVALAVMAAITFVDVVGRELIDRPLPAKRELTEILMVGLVYMGMGLTTWLRGHIRVDIVFLLMPRRVRAIFDSATYLVATIFITLMSWQLFERMLTKFEKGDITELWEIPWWPVALVATICTLVMALALLAQWIDAVARAISGRPEAGATLEGTPPASPSTLHTD